MELSIKIVLLLTATLLTGLSAGLCFTWTNAITPGIGRLDDVDYLQAFQHMNRTILNPQFFVVFFGPLLLILAAAYTYRGYPGHILWLLLAAAACYALGLVLVTLFGNVPLNEVLDGTDLMEISLEDAHSLRARFESKWNRLHLIRTVSSTISFVLLLLGCCVKTV
ncbi:DUF1772 domain-containing protein [Flavobacteriaceae bacterium 3-367]|uniref:anthrone oxygenase family protein n=1 Tax=Eudoraea algarum TaxID=3417568 RepID=UPI00327380AA